MVQCCCSSWECVLARLQGGEFGLDCSATGAISVMARKQRKKAQPAARDHVDQTAGDIPVVYVRRVESVTVVMVTGTPKWHNMLLIQRWWRRHVRKMRARLQWEAATARKAETIGG